MSVPLLGEAVKGFDGGKGLLNGAACYSICYRIETNQDGSFTFYLKDQLGIDRQFSVSQSLLPTTPADFNTVGNGVFIGTTTTANSPFMPGMSQEVGTVISIRDDVAQIREQFGFNASETYHRKYDYTTSTWSSWTDHAYSLPTASASVLGGIKVGAGLEIDNSSVLTPRVATSSLTGVSRPGNGLSITSGVLSLDAPTSTLIGGVKAGNNVSIANDGTITANIATATIAGAVIPGTALNRQNDGTINVNIATSSAVGVIKAGSGLVIDSEGRADVTVGTRFLNRVALGLNATQNTGITESGNMDSGTPTGDSVSRTYITQANVTASPASPSNIKDITLKLAPSTFATPQANAGLQAQKLYRASFEGTAFFQTTKTTASYVILFAAMKVTETRTSDFVTTVGAFLDYRYVPANDIFFKEFDLSSFNYDRIFGSSKSSLTALSIELSLWTITDSSNTNFNSNRAKISNYLKDLEKGVASPRVPDTLDDRSASVVFLKNIGATFKQ